MRRSSSTVFFAEKNADKKQTVTNTEQTSKQTNVSVDAKNIR